MRTNLTKPKNISEAKSKTSNDGMLDMAIAFDTTGSMAGCIRSVKEYVTELVPKLFAVNPIKSSEVFTVRNKIRPRLKSSLNLRRKLREWKPLV